MRRSAIIVTTIVSLVLCISLLAFSVYAHLTQTFSVSNTIGFVPSDNVYVALECRISGATQTSMSSVPDGYDTLEEYLFARGIYKDVDFDESMRGSSDYTLSDWQILDSLQFASASTPIVYTITVYNYSDMDIRVNISTYVQDSQSITNVASQPVIIESYDREGNPASGQITLTTSVSQSSAGFEDVVNDFVVVFETV